MDRPQNTHPQLLAQFADFLHLLDPHNLDGFVSFLGPRMSKTFDPLTLIQAQNIILSLSSKDNSKPKKNWKN